MVQLTDGNGKVTKTYEYDSFGNEVKPDGKDDNPFRYCGEYYDKETGEVYLRARYYQPAKGRFLTRDTFTGEADEPESLYLYAYCGNDGVNQVDPSGHDSYIIYDKNSEAGTPGYMFYNEAEKVKKKLEKKYGKPCCLLPYKTAYNFKSIWNGLLGYKIKLSSKFLNLKNMSSKVRKKRVKIHEVYIISHGSIDGVRGNATGYMYDNNNTKIWARKNSSFNPKKDILVSYLKKKTIKK